MTKITTIMMEMTPETKMSDDDINVDKQTATIPGMDEGLPGVGGTKEEIPGVDDAEGTPGVDNNPTPGVDDEVDDEATPGVDDDAPNTANKSDEAEIK